MPIASPIVADEFDYKSDASCKKHRHSTADTRRNVAVRANDAIGDLGVIQRSSRQKLPRVP